MPTLSNELRNKLEKAVIAGRNLSEKAAEAALEALAVHHHEPYGHMTPVQQRLRTQLRAHAKQLGDEKDAKGNYRLVHLVHECAYEHWHRMLFARFLAENNLLIEPDMGVAISLDECKELAKAEKADVWTLAGRYAEKMLPQIFRPDDPLLQVMLAREDQLKLEELLDGLTEAVFTASDSLGWCYQFWQTERKREVNDSGNKIGADELPAVTQLFTEDYMVDFLLDNTLGAWHAGKVLDGNPKLAADAKSENELRKAVALPGCAWKYLRFINGKDGKWIPAAGTFDGWPKTAKELKCLDPCMGSGHFMVAMFERMLAVRMAEEKLDEVAAVAAVIRDNLFGLEIDPRCTQIGAFNLALAAWRRVGYCRLPNMNIACSGLAPNTREADWLKIAGDNQKLRNGMDRLYQLFQKAAVLGSLINPRAGEGDLLVAGFHELQPLLERALAQETKDDTAHEMAVTAKGIALAAEIMRGQFTLVGTNVPYVGFKKQLPALQEFCEASAPKAKHNLATVFLCRCVSFCAENGTVALVGPQNWLFLGSYQELREDFLRQLQWQLVARLGSGAFRTPMWDMNILLSIFSRSRPAPENRFATLDASVQNDPDQKAQSLERSQTDLVSQVAQLENPDSRIVFGVITGETLLEEHATSMRGIVAGDLDLWIRFFWEIGALQKRWKPQQSTVANTTFYGGREQVIDWSTSGVGMLRPGTRNKAYGKRGIVISRMGDIKVSLYSGDLYDQNCATVVPLDEANLLPLWAFCSSDEYEEELRKIDQKLNITNATLIKVPFDLAHWQKVAAGKFPHGLPKPFSSDPTQWLFNGHPKYSGHPLHVAVARLLGYQWPRQTGSSFPDCPALGPDGLEKLADDDGILCLPSVRGEEPAAERLRKLLAVAFGKDWKAQTEQELIRASGSDAADLEEWLRNDFFDQHCDLFHQRPFIWHIWDGRKRDGFHVLVNYHKLAAGNGKGRKLLENLTHSYLGEWIARQKDGVRRGEEGADERLAAALELKKRLEAIIEGEPPYDIFVRWKSLANQSIGWEPDINDGVRMNFRPFLASDLPGGKKGAGILRTKPNIKWDKDRGKEPERDRKDFPWFWNGNKYTGDRLNDVHLTRDQKQKAAKAQE